MNVLLLVLVVFGVIVAALTVPVAIRDRRRAPAESTGRRRTHPSFYGHSDGVTRHDAVDFGGFDGGGGGGDGGGGSC